jgi:hypothetical protein
MKKVIIKRNAIITAYNFFPSNMVFIHVPHGVVNGWCPQIILADYPK